MPNYRYKCYNEPCSYEFETYQSIKSPSLTICPECDSDSLNRVIFAASCFMKSEAKTVGMLSDRNTDSMSNLQKDHLYGQMAENKRRAKLAAREELEARLPVGASLPALPSEEIPKADVSLASLSPAKLEKYVMTGEK